MRSDSPPWLPSEGDRFAERYEVRSELGRGPSGVVFRAIDERGGGEVALKVLHPALMGADVQPTNLLRIQRARAYVHDGIVPLHDVIVPPPGGRGDRAAAGVVTQLEGAPTLGRWRSELVGGRPGPDATLGLFDGLVAALAWIHQIGVHGNLKPTNVAVSGPPEGPVPRVMDPWALRGQAAIHDAQWAPGDARWRAPEQGSVGAQEWPRADVYGLGMLLGFVVLGVTPKPARPLAESAPTGEPRVPPLLDALFQRTTAPEMGARPRTPEDFLQDLAGAIAQSRQRWAEPARAASVVTLARAGDDEIGFDEGGREDTVLEVGAGSASAGSASAGSTSAAVNGAEPVYDDAGFDDDEDDTGFEAPALDEDTTLEAEPVLEAVMLPDGPPALDDGPPALDDGPPALDDGPPALDDGPPALDGVTASPPDGGLLAMEELAEAVVLAEATADDEEVPVVAQVVLVEAGPGRDPGTAQELAPSSTADAPEPGPAAAREPASEPTPRPEPAPAGSPPKPKSKPKGKGRRKGKRGSHRASAAPSPPASSPPAGEALGPAPRPAAAATASPVPAPAPQVAEPSMPSLAPVPNRQVADDWETLPVAPESAEAAGRGEEGARQGPSRVVKSSERTPRIVWVAAWLCSAAIAASILWLPELAERYAGAAPPAPARGAGVVEAAGVLAHRAEVTGAEVTGAEVTGAAPPRASTQTVSPVSSAEARGAEASGAEASGAEAGEAPVTDVPQAPVTVEGVGVAAPPLVDAEAAHAPAAAAEASAPSTTLAGQDAEGSGEPGDAPEMALGAAPEPPGDAGEREVAPALPGFASPSDARCPPGMARVKKTIKDGLPEGVKRYDIVCVDRYEYPGKGAQPTTDVSLASAKTLCLKRGKRLCSRKEWRRGCGPKFTYGREYEPGRCHTVGDDGLPKASVAAGSKPKCRNGWGIFDAVGNVAEWTSDGRVNGGSAYKDGESATCYRSSRRTGGAPYVGFRCCADPEPAAD